MDYELINKFINDFSKSIEFESTENIELNIVFKGFPSLQDFLNGNKEFFRYSFIEYRINYKQNYFSYEDLKDDIDIWGIEETIEHDFKIEVEVNKVNFIKSIDLPTNMRNTFYFSDFNRFMKQVDVGGILAEDKNYKYNIIIANESIDFYCNDFVNLLFTNNYVIPRAFTFEINEFKILKINKSIDLYSNVLSKKNLTLTDFPFFWDFEFKNKLIAKKLIFDFFDLISNKKIDKGKYNIKGQQSLSIDFSNLYEDKDDITIDAKSIVRIIDFTIDDEERFLDKILIIRNVVSTYLTNESSPDYFINKLKEISSTIEYNFELYIQEKVKIFLEQKNKLANEALEVAKNTSKLTGEITSLLRTVVFSLVGTIFISIVSYLDTNISSRIINASLISYMIYFGITLLSMRHFVTEADIINNNFENYFKKISNEEIEGFKLEDIKKDFIKSSRDEFDRVINILKVILIILLCMFFIVFIAFRFDIDFFYVRTLFNLIVGQ